MKRRSGFYSIILTSIVCMLGCGVVHAASSVRVLGANGNTVVGASSGDVKGNADNAVKTTAVTSTAGGQQNARASSLRFSPTVTTKAINNNNNTASQSYSGLLSGGNGGSVINTGGNGASRLSVGKYLNLSHSTKPVSTGSGSGGSDSGNGGSGGTGDWRNEIDNLKAQIDNLKADKQNTLVVGADSDEYIEIGGSDGNVISIDISALKSDIQNAIGTTKDILTEIDGEYKLWWCYADSSKTACDGERKLIVDLGSILDEYDFPENNLPLKEALAGKQATLTTTDDGFISIDEATGKIDIKFTQLKNALGISDAKQSEIRYEDGRLQWRYMDEYETDPNTGRQVKKWNTADIQALIDNSLNNYVQVGVLESYVKWSELPDAQVELGVDENGFLKIENRKIGIKFNELRQALNIPDGATDIEMEITDEGVLRWRYVDSFETDPNTGQQVKKWTNVSKSLGEILDGRLEDYVSTDVLNTTLNNYISTETFNSTLNDYVTNTYFNNHKQVKLAEAPNGFIEIIPVDSDNAKIGIKFNELRQALNIPDAAVGIEMRVENGVLQWRYVNEFEIDPDTGTVKKDANGENIKKWTDVYDLSVELGDWVTNTRFDEVINRIDTELAGKQIKLTPAKDGYIVLNQQTGEISVDMQSLYQYLSIENNYARTAELRVFDGKLQWRYLDEYENDLDVEGNKIQIWHNLDLASVELPLYVTKNYLTNNYYNKPYIDSLANYIYNTINASLERLNLPDAPDEGVYLLTVTGTGDNKVSTWHQVCIIDANGDCM